MDRHVRVHFERAVSTEPPASIDDLARDAMAAGVRLRRRRGLLAAGGAAAGVLAVCAAVVLNAPGASRDTVAPPPAGLVTFLPADPACTKPVTGDVTDASVVLWPDVDDRQVRDVYLALHGDPSVRTVAFESREEAFAEFKRLWQDHADQGVTPEQFPESFHITLAQPPQFPTLRARLTGLPGVKDVVGATCPHQEGR